MKNQLKNAFSPYLLQHANNPVFWQLWNNENVSEATNKNKLLIISIGYSACHWCHVMEKECFEDDEVALVMNKNFTNFKIDREELPAIDAYYMQALQIMTKQGGWPLNIVALPNGLPVWGATYVPKAEWIDVLNQLALLFETNPEKMYDYAEKLQNGISLANNTLEIYPKTNNTINLEPLLVQWQKSFDLEFGGYQRAPKFMMPTNLNFLLQYGIARNQKNITQHVYLTLSKMAQGGLFDTIEGGFSRYSVDHRWHIPHFEKMLYDNAQLLSTYAQAYLETKNLFFKEIVKKTVAFIFNNWQDTSGGFYAAYDADSLNSNDKLEEGAYYFWKLHDLKQLINTEDWDLFETTFSINNVGYWEEADAFVLFQQFSLEEISEKKNINIDQLKSLKLKWEQILLENRSKRTKPLLDDKIITSWNALLLSGLLDTYKIIPSKELEDKIENLASFLMNKAYQNDILGRVHKNNNNYISGTLEDYAFTIKAFIDLFNYSQNKQHIAFAHTLTLQSLDIFFDEKQGFFKSNENQIVGTVFEIEDNVIPSANAIMSRNLFYMGQLYQNDYFTNIGLEMTQRVLQQINYASAFSEWLLNDLIFKELFEYIIVKNPTKGELDSLNTFFKNSLIIDYSLKLPILDHYKSQKNRIQICNTNSCRLSTNNFNEIFN